MKKAITLAMGIAASAVAGSAAAGPISSPVSLGDLITTGGSVLVGDKLFSNFDYVGNGDMPDASAVMVAELVDGGGNYGIQFQGAFQDLAGGGASDALITFDVTVLDPSFQISSVLLAGDLAVVNGSGGGSFGGVTETFLPGNVSDTLSIFTGTAGTQLSDLVTFAQPVSTLSVQKDIILFAQDGDADAVTLSTIDQSFEQIPEPGSLALLGLGALAMFHRRRD
ncbi:MAG: PEP-CTERM sorting domain-containing protein [Phycisphaerales bacterium JB063]